MHAILGSSKLRNLHGLFGKFHSKIALAGIIN